DHYRKTRRPEIGLWLSATLVSVPFLWQMGWGNVGGTLSLLIVLSAALTQGHDSRRAGLFVGVAACTKAFPLILVGALAGHRRKKAVGYSVLSVAALNLPVLLFSAVSPTEALDAIIGAPKRYSWIEVNLSLTTAIGKMTGSDPAQQAIF